VWIGLEMSKLAGRLDVLSIGIGAQTIIPFRKIATMEFGRIP
jgi:hypothetical protein